MGYTPPYLEVRKISGGTNIYPTGATTEDLFIYPNATDTKPVITLLGTGDIYLDAPTGHVIYIMINGAALGSIGGDATHFSLVGEGDRNVLLNPNGTGKVQFGTWTGAGDAATNGSIAVLDQAGNARKLATVA